MHPSFTSSVLGVFLLIASSPAMDADLGVARAHLERREASKAREVVEKLRELAPADPWLLYDAGVTAYAGGDFEDADRIWQDLAGTALPRGLREPVWTQIGNVSFRLGEPLLADAPEQCMVLWERSCEAYRIVLAERENHKMARPNLALVEAKLAKLKERLGDILLERAREQGLSDRIETLEAALDYFEAAEELAPADAALQAKVDATQRQVRENLNERARREEEAGDRDASRVNSWAVRETERRYQSALSDFERAATPSAAEAERAEAQAESSEEPAEPAGPASADTASTAASGADPEIAEAEAGRERVANKLADLYTGMGDRERRMADQQARSDAEGAEENYLAALGHYEQALAMNPEQAAAAEGIEQVREALEQLHMQEGRQEMQEGLRNLPQRQETAARQLMDALDHFEGAAALNPDNQEAGERIAELREMLPGLLNEIGEQQQTRAAAAEPDSVSRAVQHLEQAVASFERSLEVAPGNEPAREGQEQSLSDLERLRQQMAAQQPAMGPPDSRRLPSFEQMLMRLNSSESQALYERERLEGEGINDPRQRRNFRSW